MKCDVGSNAVKCEVGSIAADVHLPPFIFQLSKAKVCRLAEISTASLRSVIKL